MSDPNKGVFLVENFISEEEEKSLLETIYEQDWNTELERRTQHYGARYVYSSRTLSTDGVKPIPKWLKNIVKKVTPYFRKKPDQIIINEYTPGQGIASHTDHKSYFGPVVGSLSLGSYTQMNLSARNYSKVLGLHRRSLLILSGYGRSVLKHGIVGRTHDVVEDKHVPRKTRVSITFRTLL